MRTTRALKNHALFSLFTRLSSALDVVPSRPVAMMLGLLLLAVSRPASAANITWTGAVNGNWDTTTANWFNGTTATVFHTGDNVTFDNTGGIINITLTAAMAPGAVIANNSGVNYSLGGGGIGGNGPLTKNGTGVFTLSANNTYTGNTVINSGTLALTGGGSIVGSASIALASGTTLDASGRTNGTLLLTSGQTLKGVGLVHGTVVVPPGAVVAPGTAVGTGTLIINSNLTLGGSVVVKLDGTTLQNDLITGVNTLTYGGTLTVNNIGGALAAGESFNLFSAASSSSNFTSIVGSPGNGLAYNFEPSSGVLSISNVPPAYSPNFWVNALQSSLICVRFDQMVNATLAADPGSYTLYTKGVSGVAITNAIVQPDNQSVALYLNGSAGEFFAISAVNLVTNSAGSNVTVNATGYLGNFTNSVIGSNGDPSPAGEVLSVFNDTFNLTSGGSDIGGTDDHCQFVYQQVVGDFDMSTLVTDIRAVDPGSKAGLMARESLAVGSRMVGTFFTSPYLGTGTNQIQMIDRTTTNGSAANLQTPVPASSLGWLRMSRFNNNFVTYYGTNGLNWTTSSVVSLALNSTLFVGLTGTAHTNGATSTAAFTGFGVSGARPGDGVKPTVSVYFYNKTNMIVKWQRTPRDFAVQVGQSMNNSDGNLTESNITQWAYLMLPVFDTALTGTNAAVPTPGRYMNIPTLLFTNKFLFVRLAQVDRVIPDPPGVTPGVIFSQSSGSAKSAPVSLVTLCSTGIIVSNAVVSTNVPILCPSTPANKYSYQFTTTPSGSNYNTILSVRNFPAIGFSNCDTAFSAGAGKSRITLKPGTTNTGYTFVAAPMTPINLNCPVKVQVNIITNY